jgi:hypothetical protein
MAPFYGLKIFETVIASDRRERGDPAIERPVHRFNVSGYSLNLSRAERGKGKSN